MIDIHSHILFDIDDGARDIEESVALLEEAKRAGINKIIATPHFTIGDDVDSFIKERDARLQELQKETDIELKSGAEVYITDELFNETELKRLTLGESDVLLAEFKYHNVSPEKFLDYIDEIKENGLVPLIAHPERYSFLRRDMRLLDAALKRDVLLQVNAISLFEDSEEAEFAMMLVKNKLAFAIGSDMHHSGSRRYKAMEKLSELKTDEIRKMLRDNPDSIFEGIRR